MRKRTQSKVVTYRPRRKPVRWGVPGWLLLLPVAAVVGAFFPSSGDQVSLNTPSLETYSSQQPGPLEGRASVIDGDTIEIGGQRIRFNGIDAPEGQQYCDDAKGSAYACGRKSASALSGFLAASRPTRCTFVSRDQYDRYVGDCTRADGRSVQAWLVENGHALDWPRYSGGAYVNQQDAAKQARRGVWQGDFLAPWDWRAVQRNIEPAVAPVPLMQSGSADCNIKGNISNKGDRIYHVPGQKFYAKTKITEGKGERWFCSEAEARTAGWRRSKQ